MSIVVSKFVLYIYGTGITKEFDYGCGVVVKNTSPDTISSVLKHWASDIFKDVIFMRNNNLFYLSDPYFRNSISKILSNQCDVAKHKQFLHTLIDSNHNPYHIGVATIEELNH